MLRHATDSDTDLIRQWRNHPAVRRASIHAQDIAVDEHAAWWARAAADTRTHILIFELSGAPCGVVTFTDIDLAARTASWGFHLDLDGLDARGETLSAWIAIAGDAVDYAFDRLDLDVLHGEVLEGNTVVRRMNRRFGFVEGDAIDREIGGRTVTSRPIHLRRDDRRSRQRGHA